MTTTTNQKIAALYVAFFERAPDQAGLAFWNQVATDSGLSDLDLMEEMASGFANHPSFLAIYGGLGNVAFVEAIYLNVGGRPADASGLAYWVGLIEGGMSRADMVANYTYGLLEITEDQLDALVLAGQITEAEKLDALARQDNLTNKVQVGLAYVDAMGDGSNLAPATDPLDPASLAQDPAYLASQAIIAGVDEDPTSMVDELLYLANSPTTAGIIQKFGPSVPGQTFALTPAVDSVKITTLNTADTVVGIIDGAVPANNTYTFFDQIEGNGRTTLGLLVTDGNNGNAQLASVKNVANVDVSFAVAESINIDASLWSNVGSVNVIQSPGGSMDLDLTNLKAGTGLSIGPGAQGDISAEFTNDIGVWMWSDKGAAISYLGDTVVGAANSGADSSFSIWASGDGVDVSVGDITIIGDDGANSYVGVYNSNDKPGDITVGNVTQTGFDSAQVYVSNTDATAAAGKSDITVGNITHVVNDSSDIYVQMYSGAKAGTGSVTVGDVSVTLGKSATGYAEVSNSGYNDVGAITVGDVTINLGVNASHEFSISAWASHYASSSDVTLGAVTVGNLAYTLKQSADAEFSLEASASSSYGDATVGNVSVGNVVASLGQFADFSVSVEAYAYVSWTSEMASVGNVSMGDVSVDTAASAEFSLTLDASAYNWGGSGAAVGQVSLGDVTVNLGVNSYASIEVTAYAYASDEDMVSIAGVSLGSLTAHVKDSATLYMDLDVTSYGRIGDISIGNISVLGDAGAYASLSYSASASTDIGNVTVGSVLLDAVGQSAQLSASFEFYASDDIGNITFGDVTTNAGLNATAEVTLYASADDGEIGNVTLGRLTGVAATDAYVYQYYYLYASSDDIGDITVGDISMTAKKNADAYGYVSATAYGDMGNVTIGNVGGLAPGESAYVYNSLEFSAEFDIGTVTIGNLSAQAKGKNAYVANSIEFSAWNGDIGAVSIGNASVRATGENADANVWVYMSASDQFGDISVGTVNVIADGNNADASAWFSFENDGAGQIGNVSVGAVTMNVKGTNADGFFGVSVSDADDIGNLTVGNLDLSVGNVAKKTGADLDVYVYKYADTDGGDVVLGNVTLTGTTVRGATDVTMEYDGYVSVYNYDGDVTIGDIVVKGGDGKSDNFMFLLQGSSFDQNGDGDTLDAGETGGWLYAYADGDVTLGSVDYSGYTGSATTKNFIDVSSFKGAGIIKGSAQKDVITDNAGTNAMTGGGAADVFEIVWANANKTLATLDKITDFSQTGGDKIDLGFAVTPGIAGNYTEQGGLADFAAFVAAANAANKQVFVGQVTGENGVLIAVDFTNDGIVDTMLQLVGVGLNGIDHEGFL